MKYFIHIGCMRTGSSTLQQLFQSHPGIDAQVKHRRFSHPEASDVAPMDYAKLFQPASTGLCVDSDENYSLGRFKDEKVSCALRKTNPAAELRIVQHDLDEMARRLACACPNAEILMVIRNQRTWFPSVYAHDVYHFGLTSSPDAFLNTPVGRAYLKAANFDEMYMRYVKQFGEDKIHVFLFEELCASPDSFFSRMGKVLDLDLQAPPQKINQSVPAYCVEAIRWLNQFAIDDPNHQESVVLRWARQVVKRMPVLPHRHKKLSIPLPQELEEEFATSNRRLAERIGKTEEMAAYDYFSPAVRKI